MGLEDPLEKQMGIHSSILAWEIPWTEESGRLQSIGSQGLDMTQWLNNNSGVYLTDPITALISKFSEANVGHTYSANEMISVRGLK